MPDTTERCTDGEHDWRYRWGWFVGLYVAGFVTVAALAYAIEFLMNFAIGVQT